MKYFSGKFGRIREKFLRTPKNFPAPTPMDETIDISDEGSSIYIVCLPMRKQNHFEYYLCCVKVRVCATTQYIFAKLNQFIEEHGFDWIKINLLPMEQQPCKFLLMGLFKNQQRFL